MNMQQEKIAEQLIEIVKKYPAGIKGTELILIIPPDIYRQWDNVVMDGTVVEFLHRLVAQGRIVEREYEDPVIPDRVRSLFFPASDTAQFEYYCHALRELGEDEKVQLYVFTMKRMHKYAFDRRQTESGT